MEHEALAAVNHHLVDDLFVMARGTQRDDTQTLGFASCEQRRSVRTGKNTDNTADGADFLGAASVQTNATLQDFLAHVLLEQLLYGLADSLGAVCCLFVREMLGY